MATNYEHTIRLRGPWQVSLGPLSSKFTFDDAISFEQLLNVLDSKWDSDSPLIVKRDFNWPNLEFFDEPNSKQVFLISTHSPPEFDQLSMSICLNDVEVSNVESGMTSDTGINLTRSLQAHNRLAIQFQKPHADNLDLTYEFGPFLLAVVAH